MAAAYVRVYCNGTSEDDRVKTYGGNRSNVREMARTYTTIKSG